MHKSEKSSLPTLQAMEIDSMFVCLFVQWIDQHGGISPKLIQKRNT
jgi:hypothetical protein